MEDRFWEKRLAPIVDRLLASQDDESLNAALDGLDRVDPRACEALADLIEHRSESPANAGARDSDVLLFAAPILVWSRYAIPSGPIPQTTVTNARMHLAAHAFAANVRIGLADVLFSPDQLPQGFSDTAQLTLKLAKATVHNRDCHMDPQTLADTASFLSDTRYLIGVAIAEHGGPIFRWQEQDATDKTRSSVLEAWRAQGGEVLRPLLPACASELLLPMAFHSACHEAERHSRPYSIRASVAFLHTAINVTGNELAAVVAPFRENRVEEFRVGFVHKQNGAVLHGIVWPLMDPEDVNESPAQIDTVLKECGIADVRILDHVFPLEFCDDCGAPLYPNTDADAVHAELPETDVTQAPQHLH